MLLPGRTKFNRLFLIGTCSTYLSVEALKAAIVEAKSSKDVSRYERAVRALADVAPYEAEATPDKEWIDRTRKVVKAETDRLEHELRGYKNNLIKESIRVSFLTALYNTLVYVLTGNSRWAMKTSDSTTIKLVTWCRLRRLTLA